MAITSLQSMSSDVEQSVKNNLENINTYGLNNNDLQTAIKAQVGDSTKNYIDFLNSNANPQDVDVTHYSAKGFSFRMDNKSSVRAKYTLTCGAGSTLASSGTSSYIIISSPTTDFYIWFNVNASTTDPAHPRRTGVEVAINSAWTTAQVAQAIADKINATLSAHFTATVSSNVITLVSVPFGVLFPLPRVTSLTSPWAFVVVNVGSSVFSIRDASGDDVFGVSDQGYLVTSVNQSSPFNSLSSANWIKATNLRVSGTTVNRWYKIADLFLYATSNQIDLSGFLVMKKVATGELIRADFSIIMRQQSPISSTPVCELYLRQTGNYDQPIIKGVITCDNSIEKRLELYAFSPVTESNQLYYNIHGLPGGSIRIPINFVDTGVASLPSGTEINAVNYILSMPNRNIVSTANQEIEQVATTTDTISTNTSLLSFTGTSGGTLTLPSASAYSKKVLRIKDFGGNAGTNNITIQRAGSDLIDGATSITISTNYGVRALYSNGTSWGVI